MSAETQPAAVKMQQFQPPSKKLIDGVIVKPLKVISDERGRLMEILRSDDPHFQKFGQVYLTTAYPGVVKAWHYHRNQQDTFAVVKGMLKLVLYDSRDGSPTKGLVNELFLGEHAPIFVVVPKLVFHGFKGIGTEEALVINVPTEVYDYKNPDEFRAPPHTPDIPYDWSRKDG
jgi:dTDP-4-dehydrorhamnose 3,5-epimerase